MWPLAPTVDAPHLTSAARARHPVQKEPGIPEPEGFVRRFLGTLTIKTITLPVNFTNPGQGIIGGWASPQPCGEPGWKPGAAGSAWHSSDRMPEPGWLY